MKQLKPLRPLYLVLYHIVAVLAMVLVRIVYPIRVLGRQNLPQNSGFVLAPNHLRAIDPLFVLLARGFGKKMMIMGKRELFNINGLLNFFWNVAGVFPVERGIGDKGAIDEAIQEVKMGRGLLIFPEGTRSKTGELGRLKSGAFVVAMQAAAPVVPCRIWYKAGAPKPFRRITVVFGRPLAPGELGLVGAYNAKKLRGAKHLFAQKMEALDTQNKQAQ